MAGKKREVASFAEAWIEIEDYDNGRVMKAVASFAEAWIEIKYALIIVDGVGAVASFAEAWIEIITNKIGTATDDSRLLRGGVD